MSKPPVTSPAPAESSRTTAPKPPVDLAPDIQKLKEMVAAPDRDDAEYKAAVDKASALIRRATVKTDSLIILYYHAKALVFLDDAPQACRLLAQATELAKSSPLEATVSRAASQVGCR